MIPKPNNIIHQEIGNWQPEFISADPEQYYFATYNKGVGSIAVSVEIGMLFLPLSLSLTYNFSCLSFFLFFCLLSSSFLTLNTVPGVSIPIGTPTRMAASFNTLYYTTLPSNCAAGYKVFITIIFIFFSNVELLFKVEVVSNWGTEIYNLRVITRDVNGNIYGPEHRVESFSAERMFIFS